MKLCSLTSCLSLISQLRQLLQLKLLLFSIFCCWVYVLLNNNEIGVRIYRDDINIAHHIAREREK